MESVPSRISASPASPPHTPTFRRVVRQESLDGERKGRRGRMDEHRVVEKISGAPLQLHHVVEVEDDDVDAFSKEELARRPEVRLINRYAAVRTYVLMGLKGSGALVVLWATVVLLGGFVSMLEKKDFWYITFIAFVQAGGMFNAMFDNQLRPLASWFLSTMKKLILPASRVIKHNHVDKQLHQTCWSCWWLRTIVTSMISRVTHLIVSFVLYLVLLFFLYTPIICAFLSYWRIGELNYGSRSNKDDDTEPNLKPGIYFFYYLSFAQGIMFMIIVLPMEIFGTQIVVNKVSRQVGLSWELVLGYCAETKIKYLKSLASLDGSWNLITYGAGLLDSEMPEDYASGARVLTRLIEQGVPVRRLLLRSSGRRIQKLVATLAWRSPDEGETRWLAARIVEHVAPDLSLAQFPGALECVSCLLDTSCYTKDDGAQEAVYFAAQLRLDKRQSKHKEYITLPSRVWKWIKHLLTLRNGNAQEKEQLISSMDSAKGTNEDLILQGLRILENLALDELNCRVICSSGALFSKITAPLNSENLIQDMDTNTAWAKVIDGSLKLVSRLMKSPGDTTGKEMRRRVADNSSAVKNLEKIMAQEIKSCNIIVLKIRAIDILEQLCSGDESTSTSSSNNLARERREYLIPKVRDMFLTDKWMEDYLSETRANLEKEIEKSNKSKKSQQEARQALVENKMKAAQETVSHLKEKAGEALVTLCEGNQINDDCIIRRFTFTGCEDVLGYLTQMLDSDSKGSTVRCRICAAVILKHLCTHCTTSSSDQDYLKKTTLNKVLRELLQIKAEAHATRTSKLIQWWHTISKGCHDERTHVQGHKKQHEQRRLQVALLSLCAVIRGRWMDAPGFATVVAQLASPKELAAKFKKLVEENSYATPSCWATVKLTCELVKELIPYDHHAEEVKMKKVVVDSLCQASKTMAGLESCMLYAGTERDCFGIPVKPFCSDLVLEAQELLRRKGEALGLNTTF